MASTFSLTTMPDKKVNLQELMARVQASHERARSTREGKEPDVRKTKPERPAIAEKVKAYLDNKFAKNPNHQELCDALLGCEVWPTEELLLEDLKRAKQGGVPSRIALLRDLIHANSWSSHPPPPGRSSFLTTATNLHKQLISEQRSSGRLDPIDARTLQERINEGELIVEAIRDDIDDQEAEAATRAIEDWMDRAWHELNLVRKTLPFDWKNQKALRGKHQRLREVMKHIETLRQLRDQIYYQRLYPVLHRAGKANPNKPKQNPHSGT